MSSEIGESQPYRVGSREGQILTGCVCHFSVFEIIHWPLLVTLQASMEALSRPNCLPKGAVIK